jgi:hypothetical protein
LSVRSVEDDQEDHHSGKDGSRGTDDSQPFNEVPDGVELSEESRSVSLVATSGLSINVRVESESITEDGRSSKDSSSVHEVDNEGLFSLDGDLVTVKFIVIKDVSHVGGGVRSSDGSSTGSELSNGHTGSVLVNFLVVLEEVPFSKGIHNITGGVFTKGGSATFSRRGHEGVVLGRISGGKGWVNTHLTVPFNSQIYGFSMGVLLSGESLEVHSHGNRSGRSSIEATGSHVVRNLPTSSPARSGGGISSSTSNNGRDHLHGGEWAKRWLISSGCWENSWVVLNLSGPSGRDRETMVTTVKWVVIEATFSISGLIFGLDGSQDAEVFFTSPSVQLEGALGSDIFTSGHTVTSTFTSHDLGDIITVFTTSDGSSPGTEVKYGFPLIISN